MKKITVPFFGIIRSLLFFFSFSLMINPHLLLRSGENVGMFYINTAAFAETKDFDEELKRKFEKTIEAWQRKDRKILIEAVGGIDIETKDAVPGLLKVLEDKDKGKGVRLLAIRTLGKISQSIKGDPLVNKKIVPALIKI